MSAHILNPLALAVACKDFWSRQVTDLGRRRNRSLDDGEGVLFQSLESAHRLASYRLELARVEWRRLSNLNAS